MEGRCKPMLPGTVNHTSRARRVHCQQLRDMIRRHPKIFNFRTRGNSKRLVQWAATTTTSLSKSVALNYRTQRSPYPSLNTAAHMALRICHFDEQNTISRSSLGKTSQKKVQGAQFAIFAVACDRNYNCTVPGWPRRSSWPIAHPQWPVQGCRKESMRGESQTTFASKNGRRCYAFAMPHDCDDHDDPRSVQTSWLMIPEAV